ncbi:hypothetical protein P7K49_007919 [Saguinus oedipus]|uniref:G-protein coupled receptors family 2 profile 2 domain-containing protein n=1 Tax=Saguinus oedipus TaxID=9490 RepID=A0ABQ9VW78_SAGOE|nr:hypothetical protein P7K49_007919 [Saguinus oedipus]
MLFGQRWCVFTSLALERGPRRPRTITVDYEVLHFIGIKHLHCTRNYIHLNLFASFILRALSVFIKDATLKWMYSTAARQHQWDELLSYQDSLGCRLVFLLMQYCVAANYYWLLVEGVYLYTLLAFSVFSEQRIFRLYVRRGSRGQGCWVGDAEGALSHDDKEEGSEESQVGWGRGTRGQPRKGWTTDVPGAQLEMF